MSIYKNPEIELKPCPFCGSNDLDIRCDQNYNEELYVNCNNCGCEGPQDIIKQNIDVSKAWNERR